MYNCVWIQIPEDHLTKTKHIASLYNMSQTCLIIIKYIIIVVIIIIIIY